MDNKVINERNKEKSKIKGSHPNQYEGPGKSTSMKDQANPLAGSKGTNIVKKLNKALENILCKNTHYIHRSKIKK